MKLHSFGQFLPDSVYRNGECYTLTVGYCMDKRIGNTEAQIDSRVHDETRTTSPEQTRAWYSYIIYSSLGKRQASASAICTDLHHTGPPSGRGWCLWYRQSSGQSFAFPRSTKASHPSWTRHQKKHAKGLWLVF